MTPGSAVELIGIAVLVVTVFLASRIRDRWVDDLESEFQTALRGLGIESCHFIIDRVITPGTDRPAEVYRIFHDADDRYFFFMKNGDSPGVLKPLTKERALLAAKMSGYLSQARAD